MIQGSTMADVNEWLDNQREAERLRQVAKQKADEGWRRTRSRSEARQEAVELATCRVMRATSATAIVGLLLDALDDHVLRREVERRMAHLCHPLPSRLPAVVFGTATEEAVN